MADRPLVLRYAARSDVGKIRAKNDDSAYVGHFLAVVADGMGGHAGGDVASASTVLDLIHLDRDGYQGDAGTYLADEIQTANSLLSELVQVNPKLAGMGTTVTALLLSGHKLEFAHIGDSRAYRLKDGVFEQISKDHTFVQRMIDEGRLRPEEAETHPHKNVLMRVLGDVDASPELDLTTFDVTPGERWLLCSDGLNFVRHDMVEDVIRNTRSLSDCADTLIELTLAAGAPDNITVVVFEVAELTGDDLDTAALPAVPAKTGQLSEHEGPVVSGLSESTTAETSAPEFEAGEAAAEAEPAEEVRSHLSADIINAELAGRPHELVGAAVTAAAEGKIPALAGRPAALRAAAVLTHKTAAPSVIESAEGYEADGYETENPLAPQRRSILRIVIAAVIVLILLVGLWLGYAWTQTRYYVGQANGHVAIFNGVSQPLGPIALSHVYRETGVDVSSLPDYSQQRVAQTVPAAGLEDAQQIIIDLQLGTGSGAPPCPSPTPSTTSTSAATATATTSASTSSPAAGGPPASVPTASGQPTASSSGPTSRSACSGGAK
ncbi:PP2C family protein-serine/threonine phosphatase [Arthrobacter sp. H14-L1]|uniref:PP2C family protein-serine/threonine phosphatase n=1 Tax=Arthrobacter sp. H14-L1 TaxID=2996697 RepID=UPI0022705D15|nr:PP2C family serine/threonine-protein phosphatase [Arthrobacter sp. H14-L1]MCY0905895.1 protein phosphatase 2C domain-containing protein [Arthrobacter sp. H14-L1]